MAATVEISAVLAGVPETIAGIQKVAAAAVKAGGDAAKASADTARAAQQTTAAVGEQGRAFEATAGSAGSVRQAFSNLAATLSGTSALLSLFARNNEALQRQLEQVAIVSGAAGIAIRTLGAAWRLVAPAVMAATAATAAFVAGLSPLTLVIAGVVAAVAGAIAIFVNWESVQRAVVASVRAVWQGIGDFFGKLFSSIGEMARGLGTILHGAFTLDTDRIRAGVEQLRQGLGALGQLGIETGQQLAAGLEAGVKRAQELLASLTQAGKEVAEVGLTPLQRKLDALGAAAAAEEKQIAEAQQLATEALRERAEEARRVAEEILATHEAEQNAIVENTVNRIQAEREAERLQGEERRLEAAEILANYAAQEEVKLQNTVDRIRQETQLEQQKAALTMRLASTVAEQVLGSLTRVFGQNKAFAIAQAIINTAQAVTKTLAQWGWPLGPIFAGIIAALGAAEIATIASTKMAAGGIVTEPTLALIGEAGPEAVIPLTGHRAALDMDMSGRPGRPIVVNITFQGPTMFDEITYDRFTRRLARDLQPYLRPRLA
jgi:hypothetical protein